MPTSPALLLTGWINWFFVLLFGPLAAFLLSDVCGYPPTAGTFKTILLAEVCLVAAGVVVLLLVRALGPLTDREVLAQQEPRLPAAAPDTLLAEVAARPALWNNRIQSHLRSVWSDAAHQGTGEAGGLLDPNWLDAPSGRPAPDMPAAASELAHSRRPPAAEAPRRSVAPPPRRPAPSQPARAATESNQNSPRGERRPPKPPRRS